MITSRRFLTGFLVAGGCAMLGLLSWKLIGPKSDLPVATATPPMKAAAARPAADELDPVLEVIARGGTALELEAAIGVLDTVTRTGTGLSAWQHGALLAALEQGAPAGMSDGSWSHLFNSACNALGTARPVADEGLVELLERVALDDTRLVMRLFALQHLSLAYDSATPASRQRMRALVQRLLADPSSQTAGTALVVWRRWEKSAAPGDIPFLDLSRAIAADPKRPVDVRVTALHAIGEDPGVLSLARTLAPDRTQPAILRKAALNLIGRHGEERDLEVLRLCSRENPRLAQAGRPAERSIKDRLAGIQEPVLHPY